MRAFVLAMAALARGAPEPATVGASVGVALSGGDRAPLLVLGRAPPAREARSAGWCARNAFAMRGGASNRTRWRGVDPSAAHVAGAGADRDTANRWIAAAEARAAARGGWESTRHHRHPTRDCPASLLPNGAAAEAFAWIENEVLPAVAGVYGLDVAQLSYSDCFLVKYDEAQPGLEHRRRAAFGETKPFSSYFCSVFTAGCALVPTV